jgi:hypothetical protein
MYENRFKYTIETPDDWWDVLDRSWDEILVTTQRLGFDLSVLATEDLTRDGKMVGGKNCLEDMIEAKGKRDHGRILAYLNAFWAAAPDRSWIHSLPAWGRLCDLCSESWVFAPDEEEE